MDRNDNEENSKYLHVEVITISDSKKAAMEEGRDEDKSGKIIQKKLEDAEISSNRVIISDDKAEISKELDKKIYNSEANAVITTGGTGIASRDKTVDVVSEFLDKRISGFGELLRWKSSEEVGGAAVLTRATAGIASQKLVFCLPGSPNSVKTGMDLIAYDLPEILKDIQ